MAVGIWSATMAVGRGATESLGTLTAATIATGLGGAVALAVAWARGVSPAAMLALPRKYLLVCGGLFVVYMVCIYTAVGWAANRPTVLVVALANYLWPALTVALSVPILHRRARWPLALGCILAVGGTAAATLGSGGFIWHESARLGAGVLGPLLLAVAAALTWALYSNLAKRWGSPQAGAVPLFLIVSAAVLALLRLGWTETTVWTPKAAGEVCFLACFQSALAYALWEAGMRRGNHLLLSLASYFTPIASTAFSAVYLHVLPGPSLIVGCALVTAGALICKYSLADRDEPA